MSYIQTIHEPQAQGQLADLYARFANPDGSVDNVLKLHALNPESLEAHCNLYKQACHRPSPVSRIEREIIACVVSRINGCAYCLGHHSRGLRRLLPDDRKALADQLIAGDHTELTAREHALANYADKLTRAPASVSAADIDTLRAAGLSDREILDAAQVIGYFAYANRIVLGLGACPEEEQNEPRP